MFGHIFVYRFKCLLRDKETVFWTMMFPLILATFFKLAFSNLATHDTFNPINVAVIDNEQYVADEAFKTTMETLSEGEDRFFNLTVTSMDEAETLLKEDKVEALILVDTEIELLVRESGINENIVKIFLERYQQTAEAIKDIMTVNPAALPEVISGLEEELSIMAEVPVSNNEPNIIQTYFYSLLAMACMYGSFWGHRVVMEIQANLTPLAARVNLVPVHKLKTFLSSILAALVIQFFELLVLMGYLYFVLQLNFGDKIGYILLTCLFGTIAGLTFGAFVSALVKTGEGLKIAILIGVSMLGSFLSGMMFDQMKYIVAKNAPVLALLNPVSLIADAFYSLYYFDSFNRYWMNMSYLGLMVMIFALGTYFVVRRQKYASL